MIRALGLWAQSKILTFGTRWILNSDASEVPGAIYNWQDAEAWTDANKWKDGV